MAHAFLNGSRPFGNVAIPVNVKFSHEGREFDLWKTINANYSTKSHLINRSTVFYEVWIDLFDGQEIRGHWCFRFLVPITESQFTDFLNDFIRTIILTESNLERHHLYLPRPKKGAMNRLQVEMVAKNITIIDSNNPLLNASHFDEPHHAIFRFKVKDPDFVDGEEMSRELGAYYIPPSNQVIFEEEVRQAKQRILARQNLEHFKTTVKTETSPKIEPIEGVLLRHSLSDISLHNLYNIMIDCSGKLSLPVPPQPTISQHKLKVNSIYFDEICNEFGLLKVDMNKNSITALSQPLFPSETTVKKEPSASMIRTFSLTESFAIHNF